uniref:Uncharacterized protein n=1 Tax=viral metagenome TaxID=1070528 RepID=A0A6C0I2P9_9ZZZZ
MTSESSESCADVDAAASTITMMESNSKKNDGNTDNNADNAADNVVGEECDCVELRNIKYKSMLLKKTSPKQVTKHNLNIDDFLEKERTQNKEDQWVKLDKSMKMKKMSAFVEVYATEHVLCGKDKVALYDFLTSSIDQKKLVKTKEVVYDKSTGTVKSIPCLVHCPASVKKFTLKRCEKRQSTLKSLAPKNKVKAAKQPSSLAAAAGSLQVQPSLSLVET